MSQQLVQQPACQPDHKTTTMLVYRPRSTATRARRYQNAIVLDFIGAEDDGGGDDNCSYKTCKTPDKLLYMQNFSQIVITNIPKSNIQNCQSKMHFWPITVTGGRVVREPDLQSTGHGLESRPSRCQVQSWASCLPTCASVTKQYNLVVPASGRWRSVAEEETICLVESTGSLPPGLWLQSPAGWLPRTGISSRIIRLFQLKSAQRDTNLRAGTVQPDRTF